MRYIRALLKLSPHNWHRLTLQDWVFGAVCYAIAGLAAK